MLATATSSRILALGFWFVILLSALRMIVANGKLFVVLPSLCPPYDDPSPFVVASKKTGIITKDKAVALSSMSGSSGDMNIKIA